MEKSIIFLLFISIISCTNNTAKEKPDWLIGNWERLNNKDDQQTFEIWNSNFEGLGFTIQEKDTVFKENLRIIIKNDTLFLEVTGVNENPTLFKFIEQTDTSFVCYNSANEFPSKISYYIEKNLLNAKISNDEFSVDFLFKKQKD